MFAAIPIRFENVSSDDPDGRSKVVRCLAAGKPVLSGSEENDLVVGYREGGKVLLIRAYADAGKQVREQKGTPWGYGIPMGRRTSQPERELVHESIQAAVQNMRRLHDGGYAGGWNAYRVWRKRLQDPWLENCSRDELMGFCHSNAYLYECLYDARKQASIYLRRVAPVVGGKAGTHLVEAAANFDRVRDEVAPRGDTCAIAPYPWMIKEGKSWSSAQRKAQIRRLSKIEVLERQAFAKLEEALKVMD